MKNDNQDKFVQNDTIWKYCANTISWMNIFYILIVFSDEELEIPNFNYNAERVFIK